MPRPSLLVVTAVILLAGSLVAADNKNTKDKDKNTAKPVTATVVNVDAKKGDITVKFADAKGKETEKTFHLTEDVRLFDENGHVVKLDVFKAGREALIVETEGKLREVHGLGSPHEGRRLSDEVKLLIEMSSCENGCTEEVQRIYDLLRQMDTGHNGKIDPAALKAASDKIVEERVDNLIKRLDTNKDGKISKDEAKGLLKEDFDRIDTNKNGVIERDELLKAAKEKLEAKTQQEKK